jgi:hypothetical protein
MEIDKWRQYVELHKFTGPTIKLLELEPGLWAILDHEYNLVLVCPYTEISWRIFLVKHPPQRERPKPQLYSFDPQTNTATPINEIETGDLDL